jgi:hypothetical protein
VKTIVKETSRGLVEEEIKIPVFLNAKQPTSTPLAESSNCTTSREADNNPSEGFQGQQDDFYQAPSLQDDDDGARRTGRSQSHYIQEFVDRVHPLMKALLSREVRPSISICDACTNGKIAIWRCRDCTAARILCRACIRESHEPCPTHRIEVWNGEFFRSAELWEVGLHILVRHHADSHLCSTLKFRQDVLGNFQSQRDLKEQEMIQGFMHGGHDPGKSRNPESLGNYESPDIDNDIDMENGDERDCENDKFHDDENGSAPFFQRLNNMYRAAHEGEDIHFEENTDDNMDNDFEDDDIQHAPIVPADYMPAETDINDTADPIHNTTHDQIPLSNYTFPSTDIPRVDALNNPYIRIVDTNGIHNIGLVYCTCRGHEFAHSDLMAAGLLPTSFVRYKTIFTHAVLDDFRLTNLECKASAYQYFQKIRRLTSPMSPNDVPNLYHELRRMSRLWRWMKKLKWAGFAHKPNFSIDPEPGELANFCPACPQPGINLPDSWSLEAER